VHIKSLHIIIIIITIIIISLWLTPTWKICTDKTRVTSALTRD